jgi:hypothetical protein
MEKRNLGLIQLATNIRSLINIANGIEFDRYEGSMIAPIDRYEYLSKLIQIQAQEVHEAHEYISSDRDESEREIIDFEF